MNRIFSVSSMMVCAAGSLVSLALFSGCQSAPEKTAFIDPPARSLQPGVPYRSATRPVSEPLQVGSERQMRRTELLGKSRLSTTNFNPEGVSPTMLDGGPGELIPVKIAANNQSSNEIFRIIFGEYLKMNYVAATASVSVTLDIDDEMTRGDLMDLAGGLCAVYGFTLEVRGDTAFIRAGDALARADGPVMQQRAGLASDQPVVRVRRLKHVAADQALNGVKELASTGSKVVAVGRTLIIADTAKQANRLAQVLALLDVPAFDGSEIWTYRLGSRRPEEAKKILGEIVTGAGINAQNDAQVAFVEITGTDRLMVISRDPTLQPVLREYVELVDQPPELTKRTRFIYRIQHFEPPALQTFLKATFAERMEPDAQAGAGSGASAGDTRVRLVLDQAEQLLMIYATPEDYADIMATLRAVDRARQQVQISSMIAEVGLNGRLEYGVEYFLRALDADGIGIGEITGTPGLPAGATLGTFFTAGDGFAVLRALQTESNVNLMSLPQLTIRDSGKGSIQVGGEVPIVKADIDSSTQNQGTTGIRRSIEYRKTGVILDIEPSINESGQVTLKLTQEVTAVGQQTDLGPEFTTRKIETTVTVPQGQTVLLGGIIDNQQRDSVSKIPIVGDIPLIGLAFQTQRKQDVRTELVLAITPTISDEPEQTAQGFSEFLSSASAVREALYDMARDLPRGALRFDGPQGEVLPSIAPPPAESSEPSERPETAPESEPSPAGAAPISPGAVHG